MLDNRSVFARVQSYDQRFSSHIPAELLKAWWGKFPLKPRGLRALCYWAFLLVLVAALAFESHNLVVFCD
jgi:hypothetical protein